VGEVKKQIMISPNTHTCTSERNLGELFVMGNKNHLADFKIDTTRHAMQMSNIGKNV
jgi:hypothetical protein